MSNSLFRELLNTSNTGNERFKLNLLCPLSRAVIIEQPNSLNGGTASHSYGANYGGLYGYSGGTGAWICNAFRLSRIPRPAQRMAWVDGVCYIVYSATQARINEYFATGEGLSENGYVAYRHFLGANGVYYDGHVEYLKWKDFLRENNNLISNVLLR